MRINSNRMIVLAQSLGANFISPVIDVHRVALVGLQAEVTSAAALNGTLALQGRIGQSTTFVPVPGVATPSVTADGGYLLGPVIDCAFDELRVVWTRTAGSGSLSLWLRTKEPGF